ncbi:MAG: AMP-binding protein [Gammaproteobacteria bacterium]|nr:AMP-binding protein [Gammaproteobacteria bacterium]
MPMTEPTYGMLPAIAARRHGRHEALVFEDQRFDFAQLDAQVDRAARALMALGVGPGEHVALWLNNRSEWIFIMFAVMKIGAVLVPLNPRFRSHDIEYVLRQSDSSVLITHDRSGPIDYRAMVDELVRLEPGSDRIHEPRFPALRHVVLVEQTPGSVSAGDSGGLHGWSDLLERAGTVEPAALQARAEAVRGDATALIMYTSGTTGFPKGVMHDHRLVRNIGERGFRLAITPDDTILTHLPLFHAFGFSEGPMMSIITGARQVLTQMFDPELSLDLIERERVTITHGFEAHMKDLCDAQERRPRDLSSLRTGIFAAGMQSATPVTARGQRVLAPLRSVSGYGMTEVWLGAAIGSLVDTEEQRTQSSGYPALGYELRVVDPENGRVLPAAEVGELQVRGRDVMSGYYEKPDETAAAFTADGWFKTGDCACLRSDGYLRFLGRYKDMLKVGGENVDPMEVEGLLLDHPAVHQVAVVGLADQRLSEVPVAFVQRAPGAELSAQAVLDYCAGKVASFKRPRHVLFVDEFPMTASGKIRKVELRERAREQLRGARIRVLTEVRSAFARVQALYRSVGAARQAATLARQAFSAVETQFKAGLTKADDVLRIQLSLAQNESTLASMLRQYAEARAALDAAIGELPERFNVRVR